MNTNQDVALEKPTVAMFVKLLNELRAAHNKLVDNDLHFLRVGQECDVCKLILKADKAVKGDSRG